MGGRIAVATDTNSGIMYGEAERLGVSVVSMPFSIDGQECFEGVDLDVERFYRCQRDGSDIVTSQPSIAALGKLWKELLQEHDEVVYSPYVQRPFGFVRDGPPGWRSTSRGACSWWTTSASRSRSASRCWTRSHGRGRAADAAEVRALLEAAAREASIYLMVDTMEHLRRGGRVTPAAAAIGSVLRIKPVLQIQGSKLDAFSVAKSARMARRTMLRAIARDVDERFGGSRNVHLYVAHTNCADDGAASSPPRRARSSAARACTWTALPLSIACHAGARRARRRLRSPASRVIIRSGRVAAGAGRKTAFGFCP